MVLPVKKSLNSHYHRLTIIGAVASFSILQLNSVWREFSSLDAPETFFLPLPEARFLATTLIATLIIFTASFLVISTVNQFRNHVLDCVVASILFLSFINPLTFNGLIFFERTAIVALWEFSEYPQNLILIGILLATSIGLILFVPRILIRSLAVALLFLLPYGVFTVATAIWTVATYTPVVFETETRSKSTFTNTAGTPQRIIWIIFDELDRGAVFETPTEGFEFPAFKRFARESIAFTNAVQSNVNTITAVPSMTTGRKIISSTTIGYNELQLKISTSEKTINWPTSQNIFSNLAKSGVKTGLLGWYFPYCRMFSKHLNKCRKIHMGMSQINSDEPLLDEIWNRLISINPLHRRFKAVRAYSEYQRNAISMATDATLDFVLLHLPLPHQPTIFDAETAKLTALNFRRDGYLHNVVAADSLFAKLRHSMEEAGIWNRTVMVLSADHGWRRPVSGKNYKNLNRIPLFVKLIGTNIGVNYDKKFDATMLKNLLEAISSGRLTKVSDLISWADNI